MTTLKKTWEPPFSPFDPCPPKKVKSYPTPPNLYVGFQPPNLPQFTPEEALRAGTLWKVFYDPWYNKREQAQGGRVT